jgi:phage shock protein PspC (stress-responsive transcriptional regulator)
MNLDCRESIAFPASSLSAYVELTALLDKNPSARKGASSLSAYVELTSLLDKNLSARMGASFLSAYVESAPRTKIVVPGTQFNILFCCKAINKTDSLLVSFIRAMKKLFRSRRDRMVSGICGGIAEYFRIDSTLIRLLFVVSWFVTSGVSILIYLIAVFIIPEDS